MWAAIRLLPLKSGTENGPIKTEVKNILNFQRNNLRKIYKVKLDDTTEEKQCQVIIVADTQQQLELQLKKRMSIIPPKHLETATEESEPENDSTVSMNRRDSNKIDDNIEKRLQNLRKKRKMELDHDDGENNNFVDDAPQAGDNCFKCLELKEEITNVKTDYDTLKQEITDVKKMYERTIKKLEELLQEKEEQITKISNLNERYQNTCLMNWEKVEKGIIFIINYFLLYVPQFADEKYPIGYLTEDGKQVHLGQGEWISTGTYAHMTSNINTTSQLVRNLLKIFFTEDVLIQSTVSGDISNRSRNKSNGDENNTKNYNVLDPVKVLIIKKFVKYYLITEMGKSEYEADSEVDHVRRYISKKIAELKEDPTKKRARSAVRKTKKSTANVVNEAHEVQIEDLTNTSVFTSGVDEDANNSAMIISEMEFMELTQEDF